ncbi:MAG: 16S rRNA (adenine(1518)-N(6)/adenine(1519)-N(6))-dimethyltransferase [Bacteroidetes bacterium CG2_30_33_31]|nr:MAG: 16S rRNA (adenine(1518)-N(6)/adenine(1519)-N(6))-dimethyltransferase [Bacteroidetes bacterium CG2_30_33_31]
MKVKAKKYLGQHFLKDKNIADKIASTLSGKNKNVLEIGPGMGVLTEFLLNKNYNLKVVEIDKESVDYLTNNKIVAKENIIFKDFLKTEMNDFFGGEEFAIIGNFPYNISTQIVFKAIENRELIPEFGGMFQKEVAERIAIKPGSKLYGILSVVAQAFYEVSYLFTVPPSVFSPPPKVQSGVLHMTRKENFLLGCDEKLFIKVVKTTFNTRRKMLRTSLKKMVSDENLLSDKIFEKRPEQLGYREFVEIVNMIAT